MPSTVLRACQMFIASLQLGLVTLLPGLTPGSEWSWVAFAATLALVALFGGVTVWLTVKIYRGRNWARWSMFLYLGATWVLTATQFSDDFMRSPLVGMIELVTTAMEMAACGLLFSGIGSRWFASVTAARTP